MCRKPSTGARFSETLFVSRSFSPRGLLWRFLRKKEQEKIFSKKCGAKPAEHSLCSPPPRTEASPRAALWRRSLLQTECFLRTFGLTQKYQKVKHGEKPRVSSPSLAERSQKTTLFARSFRALAPAPPLLPRFSQCDRAGRRPAKRDGSRRKDRPICGIVQSCVLYFSTGRRPACFRDVKISDEEAAAHRAPGTIVQKA